MQLEYKDLFNCDLVDLSPKDQHRALHGRLPERFTPEGRPTHMLPEERDALKSAGKMFPVLDAHNRIERWMVPWSREEMAEQKREREKEERQRKRRPDYLVDRRSGRLAR